MSAPRPVHQAAPWITACFVLAAVAGTLFHEWWLDEAQGFLIARDSATLAELWLNTRPEGHPLLWYLLVWLFTRLTADVLILQLLQVAIGALTVYRLARFSPFTTVVNWALPFSYLLFFESTLLFRSYALGLCLLMLALTQDRTREGWGFKAGLCLAASLQVHWLFALPGVVYATACWPELAKSRRILLAFTGPIAVSAALLGIQMATAEVSWYVDQHAAGPTGQDVQVALASPLTGILAHPDPTRAQNFNSTVWRLLPSAVVAALGVFMWVLPLGLLRSQRLPLRLVTVAAQAALAAFVLLTQHYAARIAGFHWWILLTALWLAMQGCTAARQRSLVNGAVLAVALVQVSGNGVAVFNDVRHPFTASKAVAETIDRVPLAGLPITTPSCEATELAPYLRRRPYALCTRQVETFCHWRQTCSIMEEPKALAAALADRAAVQADFLFISWRPVPDETLKTVSVAPTPLLVRPLLSVQDTIVPTGSLHVYEVRRSQPAGVRPQAPE